MKPSATSKSLSAFAVYAKKQNGIKKRKKVKKVTNKEISDIAPVILTKEKKQKLNKGQKPKVKPTPSIALSHGTTPKILRVTNNENSLDNSILLNKNSKENPIILANQLFKWLIAPLTETEFFGKFWEMKPVQIKRKNEKYYKHILDSQTLDKILKNNSLFYTRNIDVVSYENGVRETHNPEGKAIASAVWDYYSNGCSIRILNPQTYCQKVHWLVSTLQEHFGAMVGANVYLTPPGSQGFAPHYDDIEAFVIQLEGKKHWKLYKPENKDVLARYSSPNIDRQQLPEAFMSVTLEAGELLYFPRGTIHEGYTSDDSHSLHITLSVYQNTSYVDLLEHILPKALKVAAENDVEFRKGLPLHYLKSCGAANKQKSEQKTNVKTKIQHLMQSLAKYIDVDNAADQLGKKFMRDAMPPVLSKFETEQTSKLDGPFLENGQVKNRTEMDPDTQVRLLRYYCIRLIHNDNESPKLYYNTENANVFHGEEEQWLELDNSMIPAIEKLQSIYPNYIAVDDLPIDDMTLKMRLAADLWEHGILVTADRLFSFEQM